LAQRWNGLFELRSNPFWDEDEIVIEFVQPEVAYFHNHPPRLTLLKVMAQGATDEKLWRERNVCCF
jgi:hypothetical protein